MISMFTHKICPFCDSDLLLESDGTKIDLYIKQEEVESGETREDEPDEEPEVEKKEIPDDKSGKRGYNRTDISTEKLVAMKNAGMNTAEISRETGINYKTVANRLSKAEKKEVEDVDKDEPASEPKVDHHYYKDIPAETIAEIIGLKNDGMKPMEISREVGLSYGKILAVLDKVEEQEEEETKPIEGKGIRTVKGVSEELAKRIVAMHKAETLTPEIAAEVGVSLAQVNTVVSLNRWTPVEPYNPSSPDRVLKTETLDECVEEEDLEPVEPVKPSELDEEALYGVQN